MILPRSSIFAKATMDRNAAGAQLLLLSCAHGRPFDFAVLRSGQTGQDPSACSELAHVLK